MPQLGLEVLKSTHLEHSSVHVRHRSYLIHVPDPKITHLKNERGHMKNVATEEASMLTDVSHCFSTDYRTALATRYRESFSFSLLTSRPHRAQFPSCLSSFLSGRPFPGITVVKVL